jgi:uncharacterized membrane protein YgcG
MRIANGTATQQEILAMRLNEAAASCLLFGVAECPEILDSLQGNWDDYEWPLGHTPQMIRNVLIRYIPEGAAGKTVIEDELKKMNWDDSMQPFALKDKFNRLELIYAYCGEALEEADKIKQITQSITHKSLYANAISTARTRALPNAVTVDKIVEAMQEIYNDLRTQRKLPSKPRGNEVTLVAAAAGSSGKSCWICGEVGHVKATCPKAKKSRGSSRRSSGHSGKASGSGHRGESSGRGSGGS